MASHRERGKGSNIKQNSTKGDVGSTRSGGGGAPVGGKGPEVFLPPSYQFRVKGCLWGEG